MITLPLAHMPQMCIRDSLKTKEFGRIAAQTAKHVIRQGLREGERSLQCSEMQSRAHEIITGTVTAVDAERGNIVLDLGKGDVYKRQTKGGAAPCRNRHWRA